eukprot:scaffold263392_cov30-Tisochrysis_lutea.AAC.1
MVVIGQAVDDGHLGELGELDDVLVSIQPRHDHLIHRGEHARDVLGGLARADANLCSEAERVPSEPVEARFEGDARAAAGLCEYHRERAPCERPVLSALEHSLDVLRELEDFPQLRGGEVIHMEEMA